jgi:hypothetical protein
VISAGIAMILSAGSGHAEREIHARTWLAKKFLT